MGVKNERRISNTAHEMMPKNNSINSRYIIFLLLDIVVLGANVVFFW